MSGKDELEESNESIEYLNGYKIFFLLMNSLKSILLYLIFQREDLSIAQVTLLTIIVSTLILTDLINFISLKKNIIFIKYSKMFKFTKYFNVCSTFYSFLFFSEVLSPNFKYVHEVKIVSVYFFYNVLSFYGYFFKKLIFRVIKLGLFLLITLIFFIFTSIFLLRPLKSNDFLLININIPDLSNSTNYSINITQYKNEYKDYYMNSQMMNFLFDLLLVISSTLVIVYSSNYNRLKKFTDNYFIYKNLVKILIQREFNSLNILKIDKKTKLLNKIIENDIVEPVEEKTDYELNINQFERNHNKKIFRPKTTEYCEEAKKKKVKFLNSSQNVNIYQRKQVIGPKTVILNNNYIEQNSNVFFVSSEINEIDKLKELNAPQQQLQIKKDKEKENSIKETSLSLIPNFNYNDLSEFESILFKLRILKNFNLQKLIETVFDDKKLLQKQSFGPLKLNCKKLTNSNLYAELLINEVVNKKSIYYLFFLKVYNPYKIQNEMRNLLTQRLSPKTSELILAHKSNEIEEKRNEILSEKSIETVRYNNEFNKNGIYMFHSGLSDQLISQNKSTRTENDPRFAAIFHDFKNAIYDYNANIELIIENFSEDQKLKFQESLKFIHGLSNYINSLIKMANDFICKKEFLVNDNPEKIDLIEILEMMKIIFTKRIQFDNLMKGENQIKKNLNIKLKIESSLDEDIQSGLKKYNRDLIITLFYNLISNSYKYTDKGEILINMKNEIVNNSKFLMVGIIDTGDGIPDNIIQNWGSAFNINPKNFKGSGLGQFIISNICSNLNLIIPPPETTKNKGTTIKIYFPLQDATFEKTDFIEKFDITLKKTLDLNKIIIGKDSVRIIKLLCVDDSPQITNSFEVFFKKKFVSEKINIKIDKANNFREFVNQINLNEKYDFIILDYNLQSFENGISCAKMAFEFYKLTIENFESSQLNIFFITEEDNFFEKFNSLFPIYIKENFIFNKIQKAEILDRIKEILEIN